MNSHMVKRTLLPACIAIILNACMLQGTVLWDATMANNVVDQNLIINGLVQLNPGGTRIQALTTNVTVALMQTSVVRGNDAAPSQLYINAGTGLSVTFILSAFDLSFLGSSDANQTPLLIVVEGPGIINFVLQGGRTLSFTQSLGRGGTQVYLLMSTGVVIPTLEFTRNNSVSSNLNAFVDIGANSLLSYLSLAPVAAATDTGLITFDPSNTDPLARLVLDIENTGAVTIAGALLNQPNPFAITLANIDRTTAAGKNAIFGIQNSIGPTAEGGLLVTNRNAGLFELLIDPFGDQGAMLDAIGFKGSFNGNRLGFVLGANATLQVGGNAYLDYVGLANNSCPVTAATVKERNGSAFFVDGNLNPLSVPAQITLAAESALFFRSGVDSAGNIVDITITPTTDIFTVNPLLQTAGEGDIVFDVEGLVTVFGSDVGTTLLSKIEILSLEVAPTGGPLITGGSERNFPLRTFQTDCGVLLAYNKAAFLINNTLNLVNTVLDHTDVNHTVIEKNDVCSEPTYVGGEAFLLNCFQTRPEINFINSYFLIQTDVAFTGVDLHIGNTITPPLTCGSNLVNFVFYGNGQCVDNGTGRQFILGTSVGSKACDGCTVISADAHLDIVSTGSCNNTTAGILNELVLTVSLNDATINPCVALTCSCPLQTSLHTIFLGQDSNISIGFDATCTSTMNAVFSELLIFGNYFAFDTRGGDIGRPELGGVTGQGVIVVDTNGIFTIGSQFIAAIDTMVVIRGNGQVILPEQQLYFGPHIGITNFQLDLSTTDTIVPLLASYAEYTLNWRAVIKDYDLFCPYEVASVNMCFCPPVVRANVTAVPTVLGEVNQLEIQGSRIGDSATILVDGGWVRELIFVDTGCPGEAPNGVVIVEHEGRVGLNTAHRNTDSDEAQIVLGVNGVLIIANGSGQIDVNTDIIVNNHCAILKGPDFISTNPTLGIPGDVLSINADTTKEFRITKTGILDLRTFGVGDTLEFTGPITVILEAGAQVILGGMVVRFVDNSSMICDPLEKANLLFQAIPLGPIDNTLSATASTPAALPHNQFAPLTGLGAGVANTDDFRIKLMGTGTFDFAESSQFFIPKNTYVGIETLFDVTLDVFPTVTCQIPITNITILVRDQALFEIGDLNTNGGTFQVGNTTFHPGHSVNFTLFLNGTDAQFVIKSEGFVGLGVGIADKRFPSPNSWLVDTLFNLTSVTIDQEAGIIRHDRIFSGDDFDNSDPTKLPSSNASLLAFGVTSPAAAFNIILDGEDDDPTIARLTNSNIQGGGNMVVVTSSAVAGQPGVIAPIVTTQNGPVIVTPGSFVDQRLLAGVLASRGMINDSPASTGAVDVFNFFAIKDFFSNSFSNGRGVVAPGRTSFESVRTALNAAWVFSNTIGRAELFDLDDNFGGTMADRRRRAADLGMAGLDIDFTQPAPGVLIFAQQLQ